MTDHRRILRCQQSAVETAFLVAATSDCEGIGIGTGIAAGTEGQSGNNPRRVLRDRQQMWPPGVGFSRFGQWQDAGSGFPAGNGANHLSRGIVRQHRRVAAIMVTRQIPEPRPIGRSEYGNRKRGLQPDGGCQHLPPHANEVCDGEGAAVTSDEAADDLGLAGRLKRRLVAVFLAGCDQRDDRRPVDQQVLQLVVDLVQMPAQAFEI